ncbi:FAD-dependent oxidoreductase [Devosia sp. SL43]|uniref:FAD-dependent oxidoreductase n=1 Tax=Devosia sp. SL43 TaxID=2806348 RepID=UPI001F331C69|nr:FAD-dependent oxidoreductase [Devosia sp. SL43]UJW84762.1 NAD(P)/FAD-dependent oxidoreductase [Devosia sp. SL43]
MADILKPDLCVIGGGELGIGLAIKARQRGLDVVLVERRSGEAGDPRQGSLHRAAFMASAERAQAIRTAGTVGLDTVEPKPNFRAIAEHAAATADAATPRDSAERLAALGVNILAGAASFSDRRTLKVGDAVIRAGQFVLATGAAPIVPPLPGLDQVPYFTVDTILSNVRKLSHLVVIGGDATALELAQAYRRLGSGVTVVPQGQLLAGFDPEPAAMLLRALREEGIDIRDGAEVTAILPRSQGTGVTIRTADGVEDGLDVSHILVALGRMPDLDPALLDKAKLKRVRVQADQLLVGPNCQTSNGRICAIGGAAGESRPHRAVRQADMLLDRLTISPGARLDPLRVPLQVATGPALAQIGLAETGTPLRQGQIVLRAGFVENDAARAQGVATGTAKLIVARNGTILGCSVVGAGAGEVIALVAMAMDRGLTADALAALPLPEPSLCAILVDLGRQFQAQRPPSAWAKRRAALRKLLP